MQAPVEKDYKSTNGIHPNYSLHMCKTVNKMCLNIANFFMISANYHDRYCTIIASYDYC